MLIIHNLSAAKQDLWETTINEVTIFEDYPVVNKLVNTDKEEKYTINIMLLRTKDFQQYKELRLKGLLEFPKAFSASYSEEENKSDLFWKSRIKKNIIFGAFENKKLIGVIHFSQLKPRKMNHRGIIWGMFVDPQWQNKKIDSLLLESLIKYAKLLVQQLHLTCITTNNTAIALYKKYGFIIHTTKSKSLLYENSYFDEHLMMYEYRT